MLNINFNFALGVVLKIVLMTQPLAKIAIVPVEVLIRTRCDATKCKEGNE